MRGNKVIIIGSGLGGLECGYILAKKGFEVTVLERQRQIGGCLQSFHRGSTEFDTGMHYVGSLGEGEALGSLFRYFGLMDLGWQQLDTDCFDEVIIGDESFCFANGHEEFTKRLAERFPDEKQGLEAYVKLLKKAGDNIFGFLYPEQMESLSTRMAGESAYQFLKDTIKDPLLRKVLSGTSLKMELNADTLPLYTFAQINDSFIRSAWRLKGSGGLIGENLKSSIEKMGGAVRTGAEVTSIFDGDNGVKGVIVNGEERLEADWIISDTHPAVTVSLAQDCAHMRPAFRKRMQRAENTFGMFTTCLSLKPGIIPYLNRNIFMYKEGCDPWDKPKQGNVSRIMISFPVPTNGEYAEKIDVLTPCLWSEVESWADTKVGHRGDDYVRFKHRKLRDCLSIAVKRIPGFAEAVNEVYTSTPLTYKSYNLSPYGSAYGMRKDWHSPISSVLSPQTPVEGLMMTGQSLNLHGVLGVSMSSLITCGAMIGMETIKQELKDFIDL